ncbi:MAG: LysR family transcriptional regulator [Phycisphaerae bacterium]|nr:LysR family transcriptional regulator [Phycisphaerae bacterium]
MYFEAVKIFCDVVRLNSFSRAAALNRISQSAVSQNVLQLEKGLGVQLLDRSKRPFQLTPEGKVYFEGCQTLVDEYAAVEARVRSLKNEVAGTVSVAAIYSVGLGDMSRYVAQFAHLYPKAEVRLAYLHPHRVQEGVETGDFDLGLVSYPTIGRDLVALPWRDEPMVVVCRPQHRLAGHREARAADLRGERFVAFADNLVIRKEIDRRLAKHGCQLNVVMAFDNVETIKRAVEIGEGIAILPEPTVQAELSAGVLVAVPLVEPVMVRPMGIIHAKRVLSRTAQVFIDLIRGGVPQTAERPTEPPSSPCAAKVEGTTSSTAAGPVRNRRRSKTKEKV